MCKNWENNLIRKVVKSMFNNNLSGRRGNSSLLVTWFIISYRLMIAIKVLWVSTNIPKLERQTDIYVDG